MLAIVCILLFAASVLMGKAALKILYGTGKRGELFREDEVLTGFCLLIGLAEAAHLKEVAGGRSVLASAKCFALLVAALTALAVLFLVVSYLKEKSRRGEAPKEKRNRPKLQRTEGLLLALLAALIGSQMFRLLYQNCVYLDYDMTLEQVETFLQTGELYGKNPMTGLAYQAGMPSRLKILCLPTLYAILASLPGVGAQQVVWHAAPLAVLLLAYAAYASLAGTLFPENRLHREIFLTAAALLFSAEGSLYGQEGFGLLYAGFQGGTIRGAVLVPWLVGLCLRKKRRLALAPILAEACIVWTLYGLGMGALVFAALTAAEAVFESARRRREGSACRNC